MLELVQSVQFRPTSPTRPNRSNRSNRSNRPCPIVNLHMPFPKGKFVHRVKYLIGLNKKSGEFSPLKDMILNIQYAKKEI